MKRTLLTLLLSAATFVLSAQPTVYNIGNYKKGDKLQWIVCDPSAYAPGSGGANQVWDFTGLTPKSGTSTLKDSIVDPAKTGFSHLYPAATLADVSSSGQIAYYYMENGRLYLTGAVDSVNGLTAQYPNSQLLVVSNMKYRDSFTDDFTDYIDYMGIEYQGGGTLHIVVDGYGTLKLPNHTYNNAMRAKLSLIEIDTLNGIPVTTQSVAYAWFDAYHASSILKMDSAVTSTAAHTDVVYLKSELLLGVRTDAPVNDLSLYPNPASSSFSIQMTEKGTLTLMDLSGKQMNEVALSVGKNIVSIDQLPAGLYLMQVNTPSGIQYSKLEVRH
jgi:hypothetical protein